jgi:hypothetical protein
MAVNRKTRKNQSKKGPKKMATRKPTGGSSDKKFFDVAKPGKSMPPSTSRPAIVGHRTILKDPMVNTELVSSGGVNAPAEESASEKVVSTTAPTLKPLNVSVTAEGGQVADSLKTANGLADKQPEAVTTVQVVPEAVPDEDEPASDVIPVKKVGETVIAPPEHQETAQVAEANEAGSDNDANSDQPSTSPQPPAPSSNSAQPAGSAEATAEAEAVVAKSEAEKQAEKASEAVAARVEVAEKLIAEKTYFVPVGERRAQRSKKHVGLTLFLCLIGLLALAYLAIDSGMIKTSVDLPVRLFRVE